VHVNAVVLQDWSQDEKSCPIGQVVKRHRCSIVSIPAMMVRALLKDLKPSMGRVSRLMAQRSCSTMLFKCFDWRMTMSTQASLLTL
jgi:hypothetical protein